jgi:hypothetical protein
LTGASEVPVDISLQHTLEPVAKSDDALTSTS